eukprot:XP_008178697.1 PREDICTED: E3 SUMO-protein ligase KIAA1586-like [Acyrthosiphon pisum]
MKVEVDSVKRKVSKENESNNIAISEEDHQELEPDLMLTSFREKPECWDDKQLKYFTDEYTWLYFKETKLGCLICKKVNFNLTTCHGAHSSKEWINGEVGAVGTDDSKMKANLRKKICKHKNSQAHLKVQQIIDKGSCEVLPGQFSKLSSLEHETTRKVFITAYFIAKNQRPYTDLPKLVDLQTVNSLNMGRILHTDKSCNSIIEHISVEIRIKICNDIIENQRKFCIIVDESTTLSQKTMLVICLRTVVGPNNEVITFFFDIIELTNTSADSIKNAILTNLSSHGLNNNFLKLNLIAFVSDGASSILGRIAGVGAQLKKMYPNIVIWHCCNHRLELAVCDTLKEVSGINNFQLFIEKLYALYHQSPKNMNELHMCAVSLEHNLQPLYQHFTTAANDGLRTSKEKSKYLGLKRLLASIEFVTNLGIMYDALCELADLSTSLQNRSHTLTQANCCIQRIIMVFDSMAEIYGPKTKEAIDSCEKQLFKDIPLITNNAIPKINPLQFFRSLSNNLRSRLFTTQSSNVSMQGNEFKNIYTQLLNDLDVLDPKNWPDQFDIQYGDYAVRKLANVFQVDERSAINGLTRGPKTDFWCCVKFTLCFPQHLHLTVHAAPHRSATGFREFKDLKDSSTVLDLRPLLTAIKTVAISSSECERAFSSMNNIVTTKRNALNPTSISSLMLINCVGPPVHMFVPEPYVVSWIQKGKRCADEVNCPKRQNIEVNHSYVELWNILKI